MRMEVLNITNGNLMTIDEFAVEFDGLTKARQISGLDNLFKLILNDVENYYHVVQEILDVCVGLEADDYFGTEGANI